MSSRRRVDSDPARELASEPVHLPGRHARQGRAGELLQPVAVTPQQRGRERAGSREERRREPPAGGAAEERDHAVARGEGAVDVERRDDRAWGGGRGHRRTRLYTRGVSDGPEIFDDLYLGLQAGGALRKQRRGEQLTDEEREAIGRWQQMSMWRKGVAVGAFAVGTFGLGFTLGGLVFGRWARKA